MPPPPGPLPDRSWFDPVLRARLHTGEHARQAARFYLDHVHGQHAPLAFDIETPGLARSFEINCVTFAYTGPQGHAHGLLLDPARDGADRFWAAQLLGAAPVLIAHNACFDVPPLYHAQLLDPSAIRTITDTLLLARLGAPDPFAPKNLSALAATHLGLTEFTGGMDTAFKAAGYPTRTAGYENMTIDSPIYALGAMADTVATLRLEPILRDAARATLTDHPFTSLGAASTPEADAIIAVQERVNRVMLWRSARGIAVDTGYLVRYEEQVERDRVRDADLLASAGLHGGKGQSAALVTYLDNLGELPDYWPRTPTGKLRATKADLDGLDHPLASAQRRLATSDKVLDYLRTVSAQAAVTGRCHPQVQILGASATGRMSVNSPAIQQFPPAARPILLADDAAHGGSGSLTSIDYSSIEPVVMALWARDTQFLAPFEAGEDLYAPIQRAAGIDRPTAKVVLLAAMYGQGLARLAITIGHTKESAAAVRRQMFAAMPRCERWMAQVAEVARRHGQVITAGGRVLPVGPEQAHRAVNHVIQGSAYDILAHAICAADDAGVSDAIHVALHDELVVDSAAALVVRELMEACPPWLAALTCRDGIRLRTAAHELGATWGKA